MILFIYHLINLFIVVIIYYLLLIIIHSSSSLWLFRLVPSAQCTFGTRILKVGEQGGLSTSVPKNMLRFDGFGFPLIFS